MNRASAIHADKGVCGQLRNGIACAGSAEFAILTAWLRPRKHRVDIIRKYSDDYPAPSQHACLPGKGNIQALFVFNSVLQKHKRSEQS